MRPPSEDAETLTALPSAQRADPALKNLFPGVTRGTPPDSEELQALPRSTWQLANEFRSLNIINNVLCREFVYKGRPRHHQQLKPASSVPQVPNSIRSSPTGGHQGTFETAQKFVNASTGLAS